MPVVTRSTSRRNHSEQAPRNAVSAAARLQVPVIRRDENLESARETAQWMRKWARRIRLFFFQIIVPLLLFWGISRVIGGLFTCMLFAVGAVVYFSALTDDDIDYAARVAARKCNCNICHTMGMVE